MGLKVFNLKLKIYGAATLQRDHIGLTEKGEEDQTANNYIQIFNIIIPAVAGQKICRYDGMKQENNFQNNACHVLS